MKLKYVLILVTLFSFNFLAANPITADTLIKVSGKILSKKDSSVIVAGILYEKLPYYDDMGMSSASTEGKFEIFLRKGSEYSISLNGISGNYEPFSQTILAKDQGGLQMSLVLWVNPVAVEELITLDNLTFTRGSAVISSSSYKSLDEFVIYINGRPEVNLQLEGHTDIAGNADANMALSKARVEAVAEYLIKNGVKKNRISTIAYGGTKPLSTERSEQAIAKNRRVEVRLIRIN